MRAVTLFIAICTLAAQERSPEVDRREAHDLWEQMIAAKGGRERLAAIRSIEETQHGKLLKLGRWWVKKNTETQLVRVYVLPDRMWQWADEGASALGLKLIVCNLTRDLMYDVIPGVPTSESPARCGNRLWTPQLIYLNESAGVRPEPMRVIRGGHLPRGVDVIEAKVDAYGYFRVDFCIDRHSHLPVRVTLWYRQEKRRGHSPGDFALHYELLDYVAMEGVMIPRRVIETDILGNRFEWGYQVHLNVPFRAEAFTEPPSLENGPYAWMPKGESEKNRVAPEPQQEPVVPRTGETVPKL